MPPTPGPVLGRFDQKLVGQKQVPSARGATRDQGGVRRHRVHKGVGGAGTLHAVAALVRTMAPLTRRCGWGTQDPTKNSEHHNTTMLRSGRCGHKDKRTKNTTWMHIGWELKLSPDLALGSVASSGSTVAQDNPASRGANPPSPAPGLLPKKGTGRSQTHS